MKMTIRKGSISINALALDPNAHEPLFPFAIELMNIHSVHITVQDASLMQIYFQRMNSKLQVQTSWKPFFTGQIPHCFDASSFINKQKMFKNGASFAKPAQISTICFF